MSCAVFFILADMLAVTSAICCVMACIFSIESMVTCMASACLSRFAKLAWL
ncbi:Uncharacterised protein [Mycobacteroides abscessus subsp. abscessus]|nr:Uncharacterised protein [Mycobacteroides abscessus subsp. abscessus]SKT91673.1 Uncharacterised protein [Mycobacteroides abscessus subsp. abscessus]